MMEDLQDDGIKALAWGAIAAYAARVVLVEIRQKVTALFGVEAGKDPEDKSYRL